MKEERQPTANECELKWRLKIMFGQLKLLSLMCRGESAKEENLKTLILYSALSHIYLSFLWRKMKAGYIKIHQ